VKSERFNLALGRVLMAATLADGELDADERRALEDLLFRLPQWNATQWRTLSAELDAPEDVGDFDDLCAQLRDQLRDPGDAEIARSSFQSLRRRLPQDSAEARALEDILICVLGEGDATPSRSLFARMKSAIAEPLKQQVSMLGGVDRAQTKLEQSFAERVRSSWPTNQPAPEGDELHHLCVGAAILGHVVHLDGVVDSGEVDAMSAALVEHWGISAPAARAVTEVAIDETARGIDLYANLRDFFNNSDEDERLRFLAAVFHVAAGDGQADMAEIEEVRRIGHGLLLSHQHFIAAKLQLPREQRET
jgi:uncharacterized tellurite resistance protein B-like protein